jgi:CMP-N,N'-diacetyllegionaminic acid synthase
MRKGSKGVSDKNIRDVAGLPLFAHMLRCLIRADCVDKIIVSTDDEEYAALGRKHGAQTPFLRPTNLADGKTRLHYVMQHALRHFDDAGEHFDAVLSGLATAPLVKPETVRNIVRRFLETTCDAIGTGTEIVRGHPYLAKTMLEGDVVSDVIALEPGTPRYPRQIRPPMYFFNGALFLRDRRLVRDPDDDTNALGDKPRMLVISEVEGMNVDSEDDLNFVRHILEKKHDA